MLMGICLAVIALTLIALVFVLIKISSQAQQSIHLLQTDLKKLSIELTELLGGLNKFVRADLHTLSEEASQLVGKITELTEDVNYKSHSLNFLFKPFSFLSSKLSPDSPNDGSALKCETIPQIIKWIASSVLLIKTTREFIKKYEK